MNAGTHKGMFLDGSPLGNPEGTYRFALNAVNQGDEGERGYLSNEKGNSFVYSLDKEQVGHVNISNKETAIISLGKISGEYWFEIGIQTGDSYTTYINSKDVDLTLFSRTKQVRGEYKLINGCDRTLYLCTPILLSINLDSLDDYLLPGYTVDTANSSGDGWDLTKFKFGPDFEYPTLSDITVNNSGGSLFAGTYHVTISYVDSNGNAFGWTDVSATIPIVDDPYGGYNQLDGSLANPTNKSITLNIANLDTRFPYYKLGLVAHVDNVTTAYISDIINTTNKVYTIRSVRDFSETSLNTITISPVIIEKAEDIAQYDNKLLVAGVSEPSYKPYLFQQAANSYKTKWIAKRRANETTTGGVDITGSGNGNKSYEAFTEVRSYMKDEVYALGIVWLFKNGFQTEAFHIPGREKDTGSFSTLPAITDPNIHSRPIPISGWDSTQYTIGGAALPLEDARHIQDSGILERWQAFNTATRYSTGLAENPYEGEMAYWESETSYLDDEDALGNRIYPAGNIRHHKMPDATLLPNTDGDSHNYGFYVGINVFDIEPPSQYANDLAGFYIVRVKRDDTNSSVLDKGLLTRMLYSQVEGSITATDGVTLEQERCYFQPIPWNSEAYNSLGGAVDNVKVAKISNTVEALHGIHTPRGKFTDVGLPVTYFKAENKLETRNPKDISTGLTSSFQMEFYGNPTFRYSWLTNGTIDDTNFVPSFTNRSVIQQAFVEADSYLPGLFDFQVNNLEQQEVHIIQTEDDIPDPAVLNEDLNGAAYDEKATFYFGSLKQYLPNQYGNIEGLVYMKASNFIPYSGSAVSAEVFGGDIFISPLYMRRHAKLAYNTTAQQLFPINNQYEASGSWSDMEWRVLVKFYTESIVNCGLRHEGTENFEAYYPKSYSTDYAELRSYMLLEATLDLEGIIDGGGVPKDCDLIPNYYAFNTDYLKEPDFKVFVGIRPFFDWTSDCYNEYKRRIYYSTLAGEEDIFDAYRVFYANNYKDLPSNKGNISSIFLKDDKLYVHTTESMWLLAGDNRELQDTDGSTVNIGTGSFLALPAVEMKSLKGGYLGCDFNQSIQNTEGGVIFVSKNKVFSVNEGLNEISNLGMREFFEDNGEVLFLDEFKNLTGLDFPNKNTTWGVGYISAYDREKHRYILSKRDYLILPELSDNYVGTFRGHIVKNEGDIVWTASEGSFQIYSNGDYTNIEFSNPLYFENKSFTISYDVEQKQWVSFHSYLPNYMFNSYYNLYTFKDGQYKHNAGDYQSFYREEKPHIIELVYLDNILQSSISKGISLVSHAREYSPDERNWKDIIKPFDKVWLYNDTQSSGILEVTSTNNSTGNPYLSLTYIDGQILFYRADKTWKFKRFYNRYLDDSDPMFDSSWDSIQGDYFIDKVPTASEHAAPDPFKQGKFRGKYLVVRYILDDPDNIKVTTLVSQNTLKPSIR